MLKVSDAFNDAFAASGRELRARVTIGKSVYSSDDLTSVAYDSGAMTGEQFSIGSTYMNSAKITFSHLVEGLKQLDEVLLEFGIVKADGTTEYVKMGTFIIDDKIQMDRNNNSTTIECMDRMVMLGGAYKSKMSYPATIKSVAVEIANMAGVKANDTSFARLPNISINELVGYSYRDAIGIIAQFAMGFALFDRDGYLDIRTLVDSEFKLDPSQYFLKGLVKNETFFKLNGISCTVVTTSKDENGNETSKTTVLQSGSSSGSQIKLANNVMTQDVLDRMYESLKFTNYYPFTLNWNGNPAVEAGDWLTLEDMQGNEFKVPNMSFTLTFNGGLTASSKAETSTNSSVTYSYGGSMSNIVNEIGGREGAEGNHIYEGTEDQKPALPKEGDLWYKHVGPDTEERIYKDGKWEFLTSTKPATDAQKAADTAQKEAEEAKKTANESVAAANGAAAEARFANDTATQAKSDAATAGQQAKDALTSAGTALTDAQNALTNSSSAQADSAQARKDSATATADAATAKGQAANALGQANTAIGNALTALNKVNDMSVGGRNYIISSKLVSYAPYNTKPIATNGGKTITTTYVSETLTYLTIGISGFKPIGQYTMSGKMTINGTPVTSATFNGKGASTYNAPYTATDTRKIDDNGHFVFAETYQGRDSWLMHTPITGIKAGDVVVIEGLKFETGNVATDWSAAPEDVQIQIDNVNGELSQKVSQTTYNTLAGTVDTVSTIAKQNQSTIGTLATKTSVDTVNKTATTAQTLAQQNANELLNKASTNTVDTLTQRVTTAESTLSQTATKAELALTNTDVDKLNDMVASQALDITATADGLKLKADSSTVSNLDGRVTSLSGQLDIQAGLVAAKVTASDVTGMLNGYATQSWSQGQISAAKNEISASVETVNQRVNDLQVGGRNLVPNFGNASIGTYSGWIRLRPSDKWEILEIDGAKVMHIMPSDLTIASGVYNWYPVRRTDGLDVNGKKWSASLEIKGAVTLNRLGIENSTNTSGNYTSQKISDPSVWTKLESHGTHTGNISSGGAYVIYAFALNSDGFYIRYPTVNAGNLAMQWQDSPESQATIDWTKSQLDITDKKITAVITTVTNTLNNNIASATANMATTTWTNTQIDAAKTAINLSVEQSITTSENTLNNNIANATKDMATQTWTQGQIKMTADNINLSVSKVQTDLGGTKTQFAELAVKVNGIQTTVSGKADQSQVTQLANDINLRVKAGDVVNQINISPEGILIDGRKVHITGQTTIDNAVIKDAMIADIKADKITAGTLNAANVNVINLNANNITTGTIKGANLSLNLNTGEVLFQKGSIKSTNGNLNIDIDDGSMAVINEYKSGFYFENGKLVLNDGWLEGTSSQPKYGSLEYNANYFTVNGLAVKGTEGVTIGTPGYNPSMEMMFSSVKESGIAIDRKHLEMGSVGPTVISSGNEFFMNLLTKQPFIAVGTTADGNFMTTDKPGSRISLYAEYVHIKSAYSHTASGSANLIVAEDGALVRSTSASKYKTDIIRTNIPDYGEKLLELPTATWTDIAETKRYRDDPTTQPEPTRNFGMIAEDLADAGLEMLVVRGIDGELEGINYDRIGPALIPVIAKLKNEVETLKQKIGGKPA